jgi:hypothetical protein
MNALGVFEATMKMGRRSQAISLTASPMATAAPPQPELI